MIKAVMHSVSLLLASSVLAAASPAPSNGDAAYAALAQNYYTESFALSPIYATELGVHDYDSQIGDFSAQGITKGLDLDRTYLAKLDAIDPATLSASVALDRTLLEYSLRDDLLLNDTLAQWRHNPDDYTQAASGAVFTVMSKDYAPLAQRMQYAIDRERLIPPMLQQAKANVTTVDGVTQRIAAADAAGSVDFFKSSVPLAFASVKNAQLQSELKAANAAVMSAMSAYAAWIKTLKPSGTFAIGANAYKQRLLYEDALDMPLDQYLAVGEKALGQTREQFVATARKINSKATPTQVYLSITRIHPKPSALLATAQRDLTRLRAFVDAKHIITLPADANIKVIETPAFERTTTSAAENSPGPLETVATQSFYYVTPADPTLSRAEQEQFLAQFNDFEFPIISAHEVYPGHFTNFAIDRRLNLSLTRKLSQSLPKAGPTTANR